MGDSRHPEGVGNGPQLRSPEIVKKNCYNHSVGPGIPHTYPEISKMTVWHVSLHVHTCLVRKRIVLALGRQIQEDFCESRATRGVTVRSISNTEMLGYSTAF